VPILEHLTKQQQELGAGQTSETSSLQNVPVLLIEDDPDMALEITHELTKLGYWCAPPKRTRRGLLRPARSGRAFDRRSHAQRGR
jgi:hypothetical protein